MWSTNCMEAEEYGERCPRGKVILIACMSAKSFAAGVMGVTQTGSMQQMDRFQLNRTLQTFFFKKKKKNPEFFLFRNNSLVGSVCRAVPVFLTGADLSFHSFTFYWDVFFLVDAAMEFPN